MERFSLPVPVTEIREIRDKLFLLSFECEQIAEKTKCGQFVHIKCSDALFLRRPISVFSVEGNVVSIVFEVRGKGTEALSKKKVGDLIDVLGPLGCGYSVEKFKGKKVWLIGGGIGIFPLYMAAAAYGLDSAAILGYKTASLVAFDKEFAFTGAHVDVVTDDGSYGEKGFVTDMFKKRLETEKPDAVFACGPMPMLKGVYAICKENDIYCEVSLEERMACGLGACLCCVTPVKTGDDTVENLTVCRNGPVFKGSEVF